MGNNTLFNLKGLSRKETSTVIIGTVVFLLFQWLVVGLLPAHVFMAGLFNLLFFAHPTSRKLAVMLIPFILFEMSYDWMRLYPNYKVNPIDIRGLYETEKALFGIAAEGTTLTPCEYFSLHNNAIADLMSGIFYLCWVPGPIAFGLWLYFKGHERMYLRFALAFLFVNFVGFAGYYIHPAAPPWYAINFGFEPDFSTPGNVAGLGRFDELIGIPVFSSIYVNNSNIFAAVPSLHAAYMLVATIYAIGSKQKWGLVAVMAIVTVGIWWTAVYSTHHYIIDVLLGILTAFVGVLVFEKVLMRWPAFSRFVDRYSAYIRN
jgi:hypothetical protein